MKSKSIKFLIICSIVFCLGAVGTILGIATGGIQGLDKVAEKYNWFHGSPGELQMSVWESSTNVDELNVDGYVDVYLFNADYIDESIDYVNNNLGMELGNMLRTELPKPGTAYVLQGENVVTPEFMEEDGVLNIFAYNDEASGINMDFDGNDAPSTPVLVMFVEEDELSNIKITNPNCDTYINGIGWDSCEIATDYSEIKFDNVKSNGLSIAASDGDIELRGTFMGATEIEADWSDIEISTELSKTKYALDVYSNDGDVSIAGQEVETENYGSVVKYFVAGGPNTMVIKGDSTDIDLLFESIFSH